VRSNLPRLVSPDTANVAVMVIPTDEEMEIALETMTLLNATPESNVTLLEHS
jgi:acetate kinase